MTKRFDIHKWQAEQQLKQYLKEVDIKKVVDQSMSNDDIGKLQDVIRNNNLGKTLNTIAVIVDQTGGMPEGAAQMIADLVPYIDLADDTVTPEDEEFTPDLEDDELKRGAIQQMMAKEKNLNEQESEYELSDEEKDSLTDMTNGFVRKLTDVRGGNYSGDRLLAALQFVQLVIQDAEPMLYNDEDELGEASITGTGASFTPGTGAAYASPNAFGDNKRKKQKAYMGYKEVEEQRKRKNTKSGYMGYSEPVNEQEEEYTKDVEKIEKMVDSIIDTKADWIDLFNVVIEKSKELEEEGYLTTNDIKSLLSNMVKKI